MAALDEKPLFKVDLGQGFRKSLAEEWLGCHFKNL
jgi:hypothetical protein